MEKKSKFVQSVVEYTLGPLYVQTLISRIFYDDLPDMIAGPNKRTTNEE